MATTTSNMGLSVPSINDTDYPTSIADSFDAVDAHDHTSAKGVQIPTGGIQDSAITTNKLATNAVTTIKITDSNVTTAKIADLNVTTGKIADLGVTTGKIADQAVTQAKIADGNVSNSKLVDSSVTTGKIADLNVTTAKIADSNVTPGKLASTYSVQSGNSGAFSTSSTSWVDVTNSEFAPTSRGRLMVVTVGGIGGGTANISFTIPSSAPNTYRGQLRLLKNGSPYQEWTFGGGTSPALGDSSVISFPHTSILTFDTPSAGTVTYKMQAQVVGGGQLKFEYLALFAFEIF